MGKLDDIVNEIGSKYYPIGSVIITSTNVGTNYMTNLYGGTWELVRKRFSEREINTAITFNNTNTQDGASVCRLFKDSIICRITYKPKVAFADTTLEIATIDYTKMGITSANAIYTQYWTAYGDGIGAMNLIQLTAGTGVISSVDIITKTTATSVAANANYGFMATFPFSFSGVPAAMIDSFCDEFWWVRTA